MLDILAYVRHYDPWTHGTEYAVRLAARLGASITGACIYPSPLYAVHTYSSPEFVASMAENARMLEESARAVESAFVAWATDLGASSAAWVVAEGHPPDALAHIGTWHDLLVLDRVTGEPWASPQELTGMILAASLPCIVVPPACPVEASLGCIAIGWNASHEAARAIHAALPLLLRADRVVMFDGEPRAARESIAWKPPPNVDLWLQRHGVLVEHQPLVVPATSVGHALLEAAAEVEADLLVMGAYGRSRFSEWALGGATRHVLAHAPLPVFVRH